MADTTSLKDIDDRIYEIRESIHNNVVPNTCHTMLDIEYHKSLSAEILALATLRLSYNK